MNIHTATVYVRNWGSEHIVAFTDTHAVKVLHRKAGTAGGFQLHIKEENHFVLEGTLHLRWVDPTGKVEERIVTAGDCWTVPPGTIHQEEAVTNCIIIESSDPTLDDRYGIIPDPGHLPSMSSMEAIAKLRHLANAMQRRADDCVALAYQIEQRGLVSLIPAGFQAPLPCDAPVLE